MLAELQQHLSDIYRVDNACNVLDFVITDPALADILGRDATLANAEETLLLAEDGEELALSLFLDAALLERLEEHRPLDALRAELLDDLWKVLEGVSHFNCIAWKASRDRSVSLLELELQGEIDKFVSTTLLALAQDNAALSDKLHGWLFDDVSFRKELDAEQLERYRFANDYAARYCHGLQKRLQRDAARTFEELRHFFRLPASDKISYIHSRSWHG